MSSLSLSTRALSLLALSLAALSLHARTWTDARGRTLEADFVRSAADTVTIRRDDGIEFTLPLASLSQSDRDYVASQAKASTSSAKVGGQGIDFQGINSVLGVDLLADDNLFDDTPADVAARLALPPEGKTPFFESYRAYPEAPLTVLGARAYMVSLKAEAGKTTEVLFMFSNRGDYPAFATSAAGGGAPDDATIQKFDQSLQADFKTLSTALSASLGPPRDHEGGGALWSHRRSLFWTYKAQTFALSYDYRQMVSLKIVPVAGAGVLPPSGEQVRRLLAQRITRRPNGDVILDQVPMVSQGPKGYCLPATLERVLRYVGIPADMYEIAAAAGTDFGGGTTFAGAAAGLDAYIRGQGRRLDRVKISLDSLDDLAAFLNEGRPVVWSISAALPFNKLALKLTRERLAATDWMAWKKTAAAADLSSLNPDTDYHACLIIGYNRATKEIAFSDSWGPGFGELWVPLAAAKKVSEDEFWTVSW